VEREELPPPHPAATVILLRDGPDGVETLLLLRDTRGPFAGLWVFPGGAVDDDDVAEDADDELARARVAAAREAKEEAALDLDPASLVAYAHWTPPPIEPRRFTTWFFVGIPPADEVVVDGAEIHDHAWLEPTAALERHARGELGLAPPTLVTLHQLAGYEQASDVLAEAAARVPERFVTKPVRVGERTVLTWHGDAAYETGVDAPGPRHRVSRAGAAWHYERSAR
jgi:8-oxo-dGTP pyrophosphatase MutT (NUDIX family)